MLFLWHYKPPLSFRLFLLLFCKEPWALRRGMWWRHPIHGCTLKHLSLSAWCPVVDICVDYHLIQEDSLLSYTLTYEYSNISLGIASVLCLSSRTTVIGFPRCPWPTYSHVLDLLSIICGFCHGVHTASHQKCQVIPPKFVPMLHWRAYLVGK